MPAPPSNVRGAAWLLASTRVTRAGTTAYRPHAHVPGRLTAPAAGARDPDGIGTSAPACSSRIDDEGRAGADRGCRRRRAARSGETAYRRFAAPQHRPGAGPGSRRTRRTTLCDRPSVGRVGPGTV